MLKLVGNPQVFIICFAVHKMENNQKGYFIFIQQVKRRRKCENQNGQHNELIWGISIMLRETEDLRLQ